MNGCAPRRVAKSPSPFAASSVAVILFDAKIIIRPTEENS